MKCYFQLSMIWLRKASLSGFNHHDKGYGWMEENVQFILLNLPREALFLLLSPIFYFLEILPL